MFRITQLFRNTRMSDRMHNRLNLAIMLVSLGLFSYLMINTVIMPVLSHMRQGADAAARRQEMRQRQPPVTAPHVRNHD